MIAERTKETYKTPRSLSTWKLRAKADVQIFKKNFEAKIPHCGIFAKGG